MRDGPYHNSQFLPTGNATQLSNGRRKTEPMEADESKDCFRTIHIKAPSYWIHLHLTDYPQFWAPAQVPIPQHRRMKIKKMEPFMDTGLEMATFLDDQKFSGFIS